jgi:hypothetical protein
MTALGADAGNAFTEAPPRIQPLYMAIDNQFHTWWTKHLGNDPIAKGFILPLNHTL